MKGLWKVPAQPLDLDRRYLIGDLLVMVIIVASTSFSIASRSKHWKAAKLLHIGLILLSLHSFLHFLDTVFRYTHVARTYGYILVCNFFATIRVFADIFIIWGFLLILKRNESLKPYEGSESLIILFSMFGVIQLCLQYALTFAWLSFVDLFIINRIAKISNIFEITFSAMYLVAALGMVIVILDVDEMIDRQSHRRRAEGKTRESEDIKGHLEAAGIALIFLIIRSLCDVVTVGQLDRNPVHLQAILNARETTYGFFSSIFAFCIIFAIPTKWQPDHLSAVKEAEDQCRIIAQNRAREEVRDWVLAKLKEVSENGKKTAPTMSKLLEKLEEELMAFDNSEDQYKVLETKKLEIRELRGLYKDWEPIYKWHDISQQGGL
ncbi:hypothetical protein B0J14DRAFT_605885 [Halenospora varia]|nr:hypothetical protein B0J14DRAFT_605885 [Halenospora varia]